MDEKTLRKLLNDVKDNKVDVSEAFRKLKNMSYEDIGFAKIDHHRSIRKGYPEVIYSEGKTFKQVEEIMIRMCSKNSNVIATRASQELYEYLKGSIENLVYYKDARILSIIKNRLDIETKKIGIVSAGTSDMFVAEEAAVTAQLLGNTVERLYDVGVAGIHRLFSSSDKLFEANVLIVVAGMEGALASVVAGIVDKPVIAVPTSVGYGASFNGLSALLTMLNSCASGIGVVNIDNGFGAAYLASMINKNK